MADNTTLRNAGLIGTSGAPLDGTEPVVLVNTKAEPSEETKARLAERSAQLKATAKIPGLTLSATDGSTISNIRVDKVSVQLFEGNEGTVFCHGPDFMSLTIADNRPSYFTRLYWAFLAVIVMLRPWPKSRS